FCPGGRRGQHGPPRQRRGVRSYRAARERVTRRKVLPYPELRGRGDGEALPPIAGKVRARVDKPRASGMARKRARLHPSAPRGLERRAAVKARPWSREEKLVGAGIVVNLLSALGLLYLAFPPLYYQRAHAAAADSLDYDGLCESARDASRAWAAYGFHGK